MVAIEKRYVYIGDKVLVKDLWICIRSVRNAFGYLAQYVPELMGMERFLFFVFAPRSGALGCGRLRFQMPCSPLSP